MVLRGSNSRVVRQHGDGFSDDQDGGLFEIYREEFEGVWTDSRPVS